MWSVLTQMWNTSSYRYFHTALMSREAKANNEYTSRCCISDNLNSRQRASYMLVQLTSDHISACQCIFSPPFVCICCDNMWEWRSRQRYRIPPPCLPLFTFSFSTIICCHHSPFLSMPSISLFLLPSQCSPHPLPHTSRGGLVAAFLWVVVGSNPHALHERWSQLGLSDLRSESRNSQHRQNWTQFSVPFPERKAHRRFCDCLVWRMIGTY